MPRMIGSAPGFLAVTALVVVATSIAGCGAWLGQRADNREAEWARRYPPTGTLVELDGRRVHVQVSGRARGSAPDVVLIHGASGNLRDFTFDLARRLEAEFRVIAVDRPGLGWSDSWGPADSDPREQARILRQALAGQGLRRPVVVGHSYGGAVAMGWALEAEAETGALVILGGATHPWEGPLALSYRLEAGPLGAIGRPVIAGLVSEETGRGVTRGVFDPDPVPEGYLDHFGVGLAMRREARAANGRQVNALRGHLRQMAPDYSRLRLPIEVLHGDRDTTVGLEVHARPLVAQVASARLTVLEGVGHMPHHARPDETVAAIRRAAERARLR